MSQYIYIGTQIAATMLGFMSLFFIMSKEKVKNKDILSAAIMTGIIGCMGYLFQISSVSPQEAMLAVKVSYTGRCFVVSFMLMFIGRYFDVQADKRWYRFLFLSDFVVFLIMLTNQYHGLFYRKISFARGTNFEIVEPGPVYIYYLAGQALQLIVFLYCCNVNIKRNGVEKAWIKILLNVSGLLPLLTLCLIVIVKERGFDISSLNFSVAVFSMVVAIVRMGTIDTVEEARKNAVENMTDGMMVVGNNFQLLYQNRVAEEIFAEHIKYSGVMQKKLREALIRGDYKTYRSGDQIYETRITPVVDGNKPKGHMILIIDVTERERQKQRILDLKAEEENASKAKSQFLANISREFRDPVNLINGMTEILQNANLTAAERANLEQLKKESDKLMKMLNEVLDYSKIDLGKMHLIQVEYPLKELVRRVYQNISAKAAKKSLEFIVEVDEELPRAYFGDDLKIQQILEVVISNAMKYIKEGQIFLRISGNLENTETCRLFFRIQDSGNGIQRANYEIFGIFHPKASNNGENDGTGLGMTLAKRLAALMGGDITYENTQDGEEGAELVISLCQKVIDTNPMEREKVLRGGIIPDFTAPEAKAAVIDDSAINLKVAEHALHYYQMGTCPFFSGQEFLESVERGLQVDIVFVDQVMPDLDGRETLKLFRAYNEETPVVLMASDMAEDEAVEDTGFESCVFKPMRDEKIKEVLYRNLPKEKIVLERRRREEEAEESGDKEYLEERIERLENCLEYYDLVKAERILQELCQGAIRGELQEKLRQVEDAMSVFDFEKAVQIVRKIHKKELS